MEENNDQSAISLIEDQIATKTGYKNTKLVLNTIQKIANRMPDTSLTIEGHTARELATVFLKGVELCGELLAIASSYESQTSQDRKKARAYAILITAKEKGIQTAKEREVYADMDETYLAADTEHSGAEMFRILIENKREDLNKAHYLMRKIAEGDRMPPADDGAGSGQNGSHRSPDVPTGYSGTGRISW